MNLNNRVALVTGASRGIGRACALAFAREGASVAVNYHSSPDAAHEVVELIRKQGGKAVALAADASNDAAVRGLVKAVEEQFGRLDYLVNNAGWSTRIPHEKLEDLTDEIWDRTLSTNLHGPFYCVRAAAPLLRRNPGSAIVNISSMAGIAGHGSSMVYAASKGGLITMTVSLARALAPEIRVNSVAPGLIRTGFAGWGEDQCARVESVTPLKRLATVEDIAEAALFLSSSALGMTGETLCIDAGITRLGIS
jgi:3-oxoacyl-[acyl-carrier protein] reductase